MNGCPNCGGEGCAMCEASAILLKIRIQSEKEARDFLMEHLGLNKGTAGGAILQEPSPKLIEIAAAAIEHGKQLVRASESIPRSHQGQMLVDSRFDYLEFSLPEKPKRAGPRQFGFPELEVPVWTKKGPDDR